jgi:hypothetical protein
LETRVRVVIALFAALFGTAVVLSIQLSTYGLASAAMVRGPDRVWLGHDAHFRVRAINAKDLRLLTPIAASLQLFDDGALRATAAEVAAEVAQVSLPIPTALSADARIVLTLETPLGEEVGELPVTFVAIPGPGDLRISPPERALAPNVRNPSRDVVLYPEGGHGVAGFTNRILGLGPEGFFELRHIPTIAQEPLRLGAALVPLEFRHSGLRLELLSDPWLRPGQALAVKISGIPVLTPVRVDAWLGEVPFYAATLPFADDGHLLQIDIPEDEIQMGGSSNGGSTGQFDPAGGGTATLANGLGVIEVYRHTNTPRDKVASQGIWVGSVDAGLAYLRTLGDDPSLSHTGPEALRRVLTRVERATVGLPLLLSSMGARRSAVSRDIAERRAQVHRFLLLTVVLGLGLAVAYVVRHQLHVRGQMRGVMEDGVAAGEDVEVVPLARVEHLFEIVLMCFAILLAIYGTWTLLLHLRWSFGL